VGSLGSFDSLGNLLLSSVVEVAEGSGLVGGDLTLELDITLHSFTVDDDRDFRTVALDVTLESVKGFTELDGLFGTRTEGLAGFVVEVRKLGSTEGVESNSSSKSTTEHFVVYFFTRTILL